MTTPWTDQNVSDQFHAYDDYLENRLAYQPLINDIRRINRRPLVVLDYGCGGGKVSRRLAQAGLGRVIGVDISDQMIATAKAATSDTAVTYRHISSARLPFADQSVDVAVCCFVFINIPEKTELVRVAAEIHRVLKRGSRFYIVDTNPASTGIRFPTFLNGDPDVEYTDGQTRNVYLYLPDGDVLRLVDKHWTPQTYESVLTQAGFVDVDITERAADIPDDSGSITRDRPPFIQLTATRPEA